jgi:hypothetical protein
MNGSASHVISQRDACDKAAVRFAWKLEGVGFSREPTPRYALRHEEESCDARAPR